MAITSLSREHVYKVGTYKVEKYLRLWGHEIGAAPILKLATGVRKYPTTTAAYPGKTFALY